MAELPSMTPGNRRLSGWLFLAFLGLYLLGVGGHIYTPDGVIMFRVTRALVEDRSFAIQPLEQNPGFGGTAVTNAESGETRFYAKYGLGLSLVAVPLDLLGKALTPMAREEERDLFVRRHLYYASDRHNFGEAMEAYVVSWANSAIVALIVVLLYLLFVELGSPVVIAACMAAAGGLATPLWHYSKAFFAEPLGALGLCGFLLFAMRGARGRRTVLLWFLAGIMLGLSVLAKVFHLVLLLPAAVLLSIYALRLPRRLALQGIAGFLAGLVVMGTIIGGYNYLRFGNPLESGYGAEAGHWTTPLGIGLLGLLVSPGRGLVLYFPLLILSMLAARRFFRAHRAEAIFIALCCGTLVLGYSRWYMWEGGWCWGPRFLLPLVPLLMLPIPSLLQAPRRRVIVAVAVPIVLLVSLAVAFSGLLVNYYDYHVWLLRHHTDHYRAFMLLAAHDYYALLRWFPAYSPLLAYWSFSPKDYFFARYALAVPGLLQFLQLLFFGAFALGTVQVVRALRHTNRAE